MKEKFEKLKRRYSVRYNKNVMYNCTILHTADLSMKKFGLYHWKLSIALFVYSFLLVPYKPYSLINETIAIIHMIWSESTLYARLTESSND